ncbi:MAG: hypothetical protein LBV70_03605, partial [Candidatus Adiutrix sp.]|nr:hypothetical protein [Candidatus Adiutrix sp.]
AVLWLLVHFWRTWRGAAAQGFLAFTLVGLLLGASMALTSTYVKGNPPSSNFSYTLAALSFGGSQGSEAQSRYKEQLAEAKSAEEAARFLYAQAWENIRREPETFIAALADRARLFGRHLPEFLQNSYADRGGSFFRVLAVLAFWSFLWRARPRQKIFWLLVMAGMTASAAVVFHDAGERVMAPGYIFLGLFLAGGLALPARLEETGRLAWPALTLGGLLLILMFSAPALAYRHPPEAVRFLRNNQVPPPAKDEALIWGGGSLAGVLVVPDSEPLPSAVPALPFSSFAADIKNSGAEQYQPLLTPRQPQPPFAFVAGLSGPILIAPPELLFRAEVPLWRVRFMDWALPGPRGHSLWKRVLKAEPLGVPGSGQGTPAGGH